MSDSLRIVRHRGSEGCDYDKGSIGYLFSSRLHHVFKGNQTFVHRLWIKGYDCYLSSIPLTVTSLQYPKKVFDLRQIWRTRCINKSKWITRFFNGYRCIRSYQVSHTSVMGVTHRLNGERQKTPKSEWVFKDYRQDEGEITLNRYGNYPNTTVSVPLFKSRIKGYRTTHPSYLIRFLGSEVTTTSYQSQRHSFPVSVKSVSNFSQRNFNQ